MTATLRYSSTAEADYRLCQRRWFWRHVERWQPVQTPEALAFGTAWHVLREHGELPVHLTPADAWQAEARGGDLLWQSLVALYPVEVTPWASPAELTDTPLPSKVRGLLQWAVRTEGWPVTPRFCVVGSWASWPDAVLVRETGGDFVCQVRAAEWAQLD